MKMHRIIDLYKSLPAGGKLLPVDTGFDFWDDIYPDNSAAYDREFTRRYAGFQYYDFLEAEEKADAISDLKADVLSILTINQKKYAEMYRIFLLSDEDMPITYNYDMTETTGAQHSEVEYGATSATKGQETFTKGQEEITKGSQQNTEGEVTNSHNVAPYNTNAAVLESSDVKSSQQFTEGQRVDTDGQRIDTTSARTDTTLAHTDSTDSDEWTLTRRGNIGTQTAADVAESFRRFFDNSFKFMLMIYEDIAKQLLMIGD